MAQIYFDTPYPHWTVENYVNKGVKVSQGLTLDGENWHTSYFCSGGTFQNNNMASLIRIKSHFWSQNWAFFVVEKGPKMALILCSTNPDIKSKINFLALNLNIFYEIEGYLGSG